MCLCKNYQWQLLILIFICVLVSSKRQHDSSLQSFSSELALEVILSIDGHFNCSEHIDKVVIGKIFYDANLRLYS